MFMLIFPGIIKFARADRPENRSVNSPVFVWKASVLTMQSLPMVQVLVAASEAGLSPTPGTAAKSEGLQAQPAAINNPF